MNIIILTKTDQCSDGSYRLSDNRATHIRTVLKSVSGDTVEIGLLDGALGVAEVLDVTDTSVSLSVREETFSEPQAPTIDIICAVPRPQTLKKVLLTSAMMGVRHLHLLRANRTEKSYLQSPMMDAANQRPFLIEGLSQGKRTALPKVTLHPLFRPFVEDTWPEIQSENQALIDSDEQVLLLPDMDAKPTTLEIAGLRSTKQVIIAIGPEGGWIDFEIDHWKRLGFIPFTLGPWVLRVEHALTASLAQVSLVSTGN